MLYRDPSTLPQPSILARFGRAFAALSSARRRRIADLDLMSLGPHMRRDLGLDDGRWLR